MKKSNGTSYFTYLAFGIILGVVMVIASSFIIKWKLSAHVQPPHQASPLPVTPGVPPSPAVSGSPEEPTRMDMVRDPVCKELVSPNTSLKYEFQNKVYYFCDEICQRSFEDEPFRYVDGSMKIEINIQTLPPETPPEGGALTPIPEDTEPTPEEVISTPPEILPPPSKQGKAPPEVLPTPEEIPMNAQTPKATKKPTQKASSGPSKTKPEDLKIEEIPLE